MSSESSAARNQDESPFEEPSYETVGKGFEWIDRRVHRDELPDTPAAQMCELGGCKFLPLCEWCEQAEIIAAWSQR